MNDQPRLSSLNLWEGHVRSCMRVIRDALALLAAESPLTREVDLNRELYFCLVAATQAARGSGVHVPSPPVPEGQNPPLASDEERAMRENKRPDFYWPMVDDLESDPRRAARQFVVECKRLDLPTAAGWIFTGQYVSAGIRRYVDPKHGYGQGVPNGAMVGYLQRLGLAEALSEVNVAAVDASLPPLTALPDVTVGLSAFHHSLDRSFADSPFELQHLWMRVRVPDDDDDTRVEEPDEADATEVGDALAPD